MMMINNIRNIVIKVENLPLLSIEDSRLNLLSIVITYNNKKKNSSLQINCIVVNYSVFKTSLQSGIGRDGECINY